MSPSVSQITYWRQAESPLSDNSAFNTKEGGSGATYLSYNTFLGLSVLGGFFALDHLYLRSPMTFVAKLFINFLFLGVWWLYDASQAFFNRDVVKVFGLNAPGIGFTGLGQGIGAGVLANDVPDKKHMAFFFYALAVFFGGAFGADFFLTGQHKLGFIQLFFFVTIILAWVPFAWWLYKSARLLFYTDDVIKENHEYFGLPAPKGQYMALLQKSVGSWVPSILQPFADVADTALHTVDTGIATVKDGIQLGRNVVDKSSAVIDRTFDTIDKTTQAATAALSVFPQAAALSVTPPSVRAVLTEQAQTAQSGGAEGSSILPYVFLGTIGIIAVSGMVLSFLRSRQNERPRKDDSPPEPGVLRKPDQEKPDGSA